MNPLVSVVMPTYNRSDYLAEAIQSCLDQDYSPLEVIVVNDGSTDATPDVARSFGQRIVYIEQPNSGVSAARNRALREARGEIICLLDGDDMLLPGCLSRRVPILLENDRVGLLAGAHLLCSVHGETIAKEGVDSSAPPEPQYRHAVRGNLAVTCGCLIRKRAFELCGGYDPMLKSCEDWDAFVRILLRYKMAYDPVPGAAYRQVPGSLSRDYLSMYDDAVAMMRKNEPFAPNRLQFRVDAFRALVAQTRGITLAKLLREHGRKDAVRMLFRLLRQRPSMALYLLPIVGTGLWNRALWLVGTGPLRRR